MASIDGQVPNEGWCWSCGDLATSPNEAPIVTRLRERAEAAEAALNRVVALREEWVRTRGGMWNTAYVMELSEALGDYSQQRRPA